MCLDKKRVSDTLSKNKRTFIFVTGSLSISVGVAGIEKAPSTHLIEILVGLSIITGIYEKKSDDLC